MTSHQSLRNAHTEAVASYRRRYPRSAEQFEAASRYMPGGNTRSVLYYEPYPLVMVSGAGCRLTDLDAHEYVDFLGEYTAGIYGHSNPVIREAIYSAIAAGLNLAAPNVYEAELAQILCGRFPSLELVRFTNSGSEANLMAVGAAKHYTRRSKVLVFEGGYHGGFMNFVRGSSPLNAPYDFIVARYNDLDAAAAVFERSRDELAAVLVEPMLGSGGCVPATQGFLCLLRAESSRHDCMLIFDEVMTSRLDAGGLQKRLAIKPDLTTLGKYIGGGSSIGVFGGRGDIMRLFDPRASNALPHAGTFNNNIISMAAGVAGLKQVFTPSAATELNKRGTELREQLNSICRDSSTSLQFTGIGSLMNAHATLEAITRPVWPDERQHLTKSLLFYHLLEQGFYIAPRGFITISLPISDVEIQSLCGSVAEFAERYKSVLSP